MARLFSTLCLLSLAVGHADGGDTDFAPALALEPAQETPVAAEHLSTPKKASKPKLSEVAVDPFTGKVKRQKVRMRAGADVESAIVKELEKNDLLTVVGEKGDFWAVEAPSDVKAYVFRSFILDNTIEANRVNVRLKPSLDGPVIGHLNSGETVNGSISAENTKWIEIPVPASCHFYIAKELVERVGGPEMKAQLEKRKGAVEQLLQAATFVHKTELAKPFNAMDPEKVSRAYHAVIADYADFPASVQTAQEELASFQEAYLEKSIAYRDTHSDELKKMGKREPLLSATDKMKMWEPIEDALYVSWSNINDSKSKEDYYEEQKMAAVGVTGILEPYSASVRGKPADFIVKDKDLPVAYVYSTVVNLQELVGKKVTLIGAPRPNNNFAFPAYFVLSAE